NRVWPGWPAPASGRRLDWREVQESVPASDRRQARSAVSVAGSSRSPSLPGDFLQICGPQLDALGVARRLRGDLRPDEFDRFLPHPLDLLVGELDDLAAGIAQDLQGFFDPIGMHLAGQEIGLLEDALDLVALPLGQGIPAVEID